MASANLLYLGDLLCQRYGSHVRCPTRPGTVCCCRDRLRHGNLSYPSGPPGFFLHLGIVCVRCDAPGAEARRRVGSSSKSTAAPALASNALGTCGASGPASHTHWPAPGHQRSRGKARQGSKCSAALSNAAIRVQALHHCIALGRVTFLALCFVCKLRTSEQAVRGVPRGHDATDGAERLGSFRFASVVCTADADRRGTRAPQSAVCGCAAVSCGPCGASIAASLAGC